MTAAGIPKPGGGQRFMAFLKRTPVKIAIVIIAAIWSLPTVGLLVSSFRNQIDISASGWWTVLQHPFEAGQWTLSNYTDVLGAGGMAEAFVNSLIVTIPATVIPITLAAFAAYAFAWMKFWGRTAMFVMVVILLVVPLQMALIPVLRMYTGFDLNGTFLGVWLAHAAFGLPLAIYLFYTYIAQIPKDIFESAFIDGASHYDTFVRLVLPLAMPAIASFAIFQFLWVWNDLLIALVFLGTGDDVTIVTSRLNELVGTKGQQWHLLTAGAFLTMVIPLAVFLGLQRYFVRGMMAGSVKG